MYLVICKDKYGLSIAAIKERRCDAVGIANILVMQAATATYHVRKLDLATINLDKLMEAES